VVVPAWFDVAPGSKFQTELFYMNADRKKKRRRFPDGLVHHMLFGFNREASSIGPSSDGVVTVKSQLIPEAQADSVSIQGFDISHAAILKLPEASEALNRILAADRN
jgi:hypothetical protein